MGIKTALNVKHIELHGKMVEFAGYELPVQYTDIAAEHMAVREKVGIFDVSHMGEFTLKGKDSLKNLNEIFTNDFTSMTDGRVRYSPMCNENGGIIDDLLIYRRNADEYLIIPNASNRHTDFEHIKANLRGDVEFEDISDTISQIIVIGPNSKELIKEITPESDIPLKYFTFTANAKVGGIECLLSQTGYTNEHGYEIYCRSEDICGLWDKIFEVGEKYGLTPCGLGARDTLRFEAAMPLYGHEMSEEITPLETNLQFAVKMDKPYFIGKSGLEAKGTPTRRRVGIRVTGRGIAREHCTVYIGERRIGETTSGTYCPYLKGAYAMAIIDTADSQEGTAVEIDVRGRRIAAEIIELPFMTQS